MKKDSPTEMGFIEGRAFTIGRDGHIRIDDPSLSRGHAELKFMDGKIRLRDLGSTNGTYLLAEDKAISVDERYVTPDQRVVLGSKQYTVKALLALAGIYVSYSDDIGLVIKTAGPEPQVVTVKPELDDIVSMTISRLFD